jgi:intracellular sulfur oxidation DsrE/DsrF family protein
MVPRLFQKFITILAQKRIKFMQDNGFSMLICTGHVDKHDMKYDQLVVLVSAALKEIVETNEEIALMMNSENENRARHFK